MKKRIQIEVDETIYLQLKEYLPEKTQSEVLRSLINLLLRTQETVNEYLPLDILNNKIMLVKKDQVIPELVDKFNRKKGNKISGH